MKKILLLFCFAAITSFGFSQAKIITNGKTIIGPNAGVTPVEQLHVVGKISLNSGQANNGIFGETDSRRFTLATNTSTAQSSGFFEMFGSETQTGGIANRAGEFNFGGKKFIFRSNKSPGNFGQFALVINPDNAAFFYTTSTNKQGNTAWSTFSDKRLKKDIRDFDKGLDDVLKINPVYYTYNGKAGTDSSREFVGVIAQEFQKIAPYDVEMTKLPSDVYDSSDDQVEDEYLSINDASVKYMLVNAIKEQQAMLDAQAEQIALLQESISSIGSTESTNNTNISLSAYDLAELDQNTPNPFNAQTIIAYVIPTDAQNSQISVFGQNGQLMKTLEIEHVGQGTLTVDASDLPSGTYSYQLVVDGRNIQTNKMVVTK